MDNRNEGHDGRPNALAPFDDSQPFETGRRSVEQEAAVRSEAPKEIGPPIPHKGWPFWLHAIYKAFGSSKVPALSRKEREEMLLLHTSALEMNAEYDLQRKRERIRRESIQELRDLSAEVPSASCAFWNTKGAGATTTTTVHAAAVWAELSRSLVALVDGNPAAGTCAARLDLNYGDTVTTQELARTIQDDEQLAHRDFKSEISKARPSVNGVRVISADSIMDEHRRLSGKDMSLVLELIGYNSEYLAVDTGNDVGDVVARAVAASVDVFVFTANVAVPDSLRKLSTTMETLRNLGYADKVNRSVVVISNLPKGAQLSDYRKFLDEVDYNDEVTRPLQRLFDGQFLGVPEDPYVKLDRVVDLNRLQWETLQAYINIVIAIMHQHPKYTNCTPMA